MLFYLFICRTCYYASHGMEDLINSILILFLTFTCVKVTTWKNHVINVKKIKKYTSSKKRTLKQLGVKDLKFMKGFISKVFSIIDIVTKHIYPFKKYMITYQNSILNLLDEDWVKLDYVPIFRRLKFYITSCRAIG